MKSIVPVFLLVALILGISLQAEAKKGEGVSGVVNINLASQEELMLLPGIGPSKATAIINFRTSEKFQNSEDLKKVKGIGDKLYESLKPYISIEGPTTAKLEKAVTKDVSAN